MQPWDRKTVENGLALERPRLVRLCARWSGVPEAADDLAQETLVAAWKSLDRLDDWSRLSPWLTGIARNVCLNWSRRHYWEQEHLQPLDDESQSPGEEKPAGDGWARLLDRALALLPAETAGILREHYIHRAPQAAIAARLGVSPNTVAVRLHRGKTALRHLLTTSLRQEAIESGLIQEQAAAWEETPVWCPVCGRCRLLGKFQRQGRSPLFALRCPQCSPDPDELMVGLDLSQPCHIRLLGNVKTYKPAYTRLITSLAVLYDRAIREHSAPCLACGRPASITYQTWRRTVYPDQFHQMILHCPHCGWASNKSLWGMVLARPDSQRFWRDHPRLRTLPPREIEFQGAPAVVTRVESVTGSAVLDAIARSDTLEIVAVHAHTGSGVALT